MENVLTAGSKRFIRRNYEDDLGEHSSFLFWNPIANQNVETFLCHFRRSCAEWCRHVFKELVRIIYTITQTFHKLSVSKLFFFLVIQKELNNIKDN